MGGGGPYRHVGRVYGIKLDEGGLYRTTHLPGRVSQRGFQPPLRTEVLAVPPSASTHRNKFFPTGRWDVPIR
jgi:hypothetical protein